MTPTPDLAVQSLSRRIGHALQMALAVPAELPPPLLLVRSKEPLAPAILARAHVMPQARREALVIYTRCLEHFRSRVQRGAELDDAGLAAAHFVLVNLAALHDLHPRSEALELVEHQMRHLLGSLDGWRGAPLRDQQSAFEQFAVLAVLMAESTQRAREQGDEALAHVRRAARAYLVQWLGVDPGRLVLGERGISLEMAPA